MSNNISNILKIISQAVEKKIYGSVEVYFEEGNITQVTQRIINKVRKAKSEKIAKNDVIRVREFPKQTTP